MKRKIALFMVLAMLISLIPMNVFADSDNSVDKVLTVADDAAIRTGAGAGEIEANFLQLYEKTKGQWQGKTQTFRLQLTNGEWIFDTSDLATTMAGATVYAGTVGTGTDVTTISKISASIAEVTIYTTSTSAAEQGYIRIPMNYDVTGAGEVKVAVDAKESYVSSGNVLIANAGSGATKVTIESKTFAASATLNNMIVDETKLGSLKSGTQTIKLRLPAGFEWTDTSGIVISKAGGFGSGDFTTTATFSSSTPRDVVLAFGAVVPTATQTGTFVIKNLDVLATSDAKVGDVNVVITSEDSNTKVTGETVKVGVYSDYSVAVTANEAVPTLYSGEFVNGGNDDKHKLAELKIKEDVAQSYMTAKRTVIEFPSDVKILGYKVTKSENLTGGVVANTAFTDVSANNSNKVEWTFNTSSSKVDFRVTFYVSTIATYTGDITAKVSGSAFSKETSVVLGKAIAPATFTGVSKDVKIGVQNQEFGDMTITEAAAGVWDQNKNVVVSLPTGFKWKTAPTVKVTKGDITIKTDNVTASNATLTIPVKYESSVASELSITGGTVTLDRTIPEGDFKVTVGGTSLVMNDDTDAPVAENGKFDENTVGGIVLLRVITPAPGDTQAGEKVVFTIDSAEYMIGAVKMTSDAAPYINEQGRTMLPLRALANALGVEDRNILWNDAEHSVVIFKGDATLKVIIGQMYFNKNGVMIPMDTQAVIMNSRTFLPLRAMGEALGAVVTWDEATRTVTVQ